jgi:Trypsin-like peptidase domain
MNRGANAKEAVAGNPHRFLDLDGTDTPGYQVIFPILKQVKGGSLELIGTGFFIASMGLFASAKHVLRDCFDEKGNQTYPICLLHFLPDNEYLFRHILWCSSHPSADVAIGLAEPALGAESNGVLTLTTSSPAMSETVVTYAYPRTEIQQVGTLEVLNFKPAFYTGRVVEIFPNGRDQCLLPGPCYQTSMVIHGGASGGPVVGKSGRVFALNSTGYNGASDISFVSRVEEILHLAIPFIKLPSGQEVGSVIAKDLADAGWIDVQRIAPK